LKKNQSNHFLFCWRRPRPRFRRHQERLQRQLFWFFLLFCLFDGRHWWKNHSQLKRTAQK